VFVGTWDPEQATEWRAVDADMAYTVSAEIRLHDGLEQRRIMKRRTGRKGSSVDPQGRGLLIFLETA